MNSITQREFHKRFEEFIKDEKCDMSNVHMWYNKKILQLYKQLDSEGLTVRPGFYVNDINEVIYEEEEQ